MEKKLKPAHALITGGAGFIGTHLCEELLGRGFQVTVLDNFLTAPKTHLDFLKQMSSVRIIRGSVLDAGLVERLIRRCDIVYHLAAAVGVQYILSHPLNALLTNVEGTEIVLRLSAKYRKKVVIASSSEIYGKHPRSIIREDDDRVLGSTRLSRWVYAESKAVDECLALAYAREKKLPVVIVRFFNTVGPRQTGRYGMVLPRFIQQALSGRPITVYGDGSQIRTFTYVKDAIRAVAELSLLKRAEGEIFNIGGRDPVTIKALAQKVKKATGSRSRIQCIPFQKAFGKCAAGFEEIECRVPDISKLKRFISYRAHHNMDRIIAETVAYFTAQKKRKK